MTNPVATPSPRPTLAPAYCRSTPAEITDVQRALNVLAGECRLAEDGVLGPDTEAALRAFQRDEHLPETGCLDVATQSALLASAGRALESPREAPPSASDTARGSSADRRRASDDEGLARIREAALETIESVAARGRRDVDSSARATRTHANEADARAAFESQAARLLDVHHWDELSTVAGASFELVNPYGDATDRPARAGDFVRIDLPGPGWISWVRIESTSVDANRVELVVRPSHDPTARVPDPSRIDHFFTREATNTFSLERRGRTIVAEVNGGNESANLAGPLTQDLESRISAEGAWGVELPGGTRLGMQQLQWWLFTRNLVAADH